MQTFLLYFISCPFCEVKGQYIDRKVVYPCKDSFKAKQRTDDGIRETMRDVETNDDTQKLKGIVAKSPLLELKHFSFVGNVGLDYLHQFCLGIYLAS